VELLCEPDGEHGGVEAYVEPLAARSSLGALTGKQLVNERLQVSAPLVDPQDLHFETMALRELPSAQPYILGAADLAAHRVTGVEFVSHDVEIPRPVADDKLVHGKLLQIRGFTLALAASAFSLSPVSLHMLFYLNEQRRFWGV
jgi:hypothetical protein